MLVIVWRRRPIKTEQSPRPEADSFTAVFAGFHENIAIQLQRAINVVPNGPSFGAIRIASRDHRSASSASPRTKAMAERLVKTLALGAPQQCFIEATRRLKVLTPLLRAPGLLWRPLLFQPCTHHSTR